MNYIKPQKCAWNKDKTKSVVLAKLKEFTITYRQESDSIVWLVKGFFNLENSFLFGEFSSEKEAQDFLESIHNMF